MSRPTRYEIEIRGRADERILRPVVDDFRIETTDRRTTLVVGDVRDAAHLHGLLAHFTSVHVEIVSLRRLDGARGVDRPPTCTPSSTGTSTTGTSTTGTSTTETSTTTSTSERNP